MKIPIKESLFHFCLLYFLTILHVAIAADTIDTTEIIRDGDTLISANRSFELGFFSPTNSTNQYLGIWYYNISVRTPFWVANREAPLTNGSSGVLRIIEPGRLVIQDERNNTIWTSSNSSRTAQNPVVQLLDSGNLVLRDGNDENYLWQSFDHPSDTFIQGMDFGWNLVTGIERYTTSWRTDEDPAPGDFTFRLDIRGYPQAVVRRGNAILYRIGPWNGMRFSGQPSVRRNPTFTADLYMNSSVVYYREIALDRSDIARFTISPTGTAQRWKWVNTNQTWASDYRLPADICDSYGLCGAHGNCVVGNSPNCGCLDRFRPRDEQAWLRSDFSGGCVRRTNLSCGGDVFLRYTGIKMPDSRNTWYNRSMNLEECKTVCLRNCTCMAYSNLDIRGGGSGCLLWIGNLVDIRLLPGETQEIFIRMAASELASKGKKARILIAVLATLVGMALIGLGLMLFLRKRRKNNQLLYEEEEHEENHHEDLELPTFDLVTITKATNNFSIDSKLGEGGFGPVYKGKLEDGKEIAVKRLSRTSMQGLDEFKNEVICIAKLQHRNLVKLLGCCIQGQEKMLIYEYMPNKSLELILFDQTKSKMLDWPKRFNIIYGIARGLMYLHQDSRLRIIHRDLKASNILLDSKMNPKISDFGMARSFGGNETQGNTSRVVGTYGYMSPEYAVDGLFSIKSDVFSFGVLVLEIVSGKTNRGFQHKDHHHNLLGHAWMLYKERRSLEVVDDNLGDTLNTSDVLRSIHVALLCVQQYPEDRPNMSQVVFMLGSETPLPRAKQPGFFEERDVFGPDNSTSRNAGISSNDFTITRVQPR